MTVPEDKCQALDQLASVDIDARGTFKYVLIEAAVEDKDGKERVRPRVLATCCAYLVFVGLDRRMRDM